MKRLNWRKNKMPMRFLSLLFLFNLISLKLFGQVGINTSDPQAMLDVSSTTDGVLFPRLTQSQVDALNDPEEGLMLYNLDKHCLQIYEGIQWKCLDFKTQSNTPSTINNRISRTIDELDNSFEETSGLVYLDSGFFLMHNDGENILYKIKETAPYEIVKQYQLPMSIRDWEAITISEEFVFIGDFGNNYGRRYVNKVYYFPIDELRKEGNIVNIDNVESFTFNYPEQTSFNTPVNETDYDTEAFIYINGELHFFTKQWLSYGTRHYKIPFSENLPNNVDAILLEDYDTQFLVTDAAYRNANGAHHLFLVGYNLNSYSIKFMQFTGNNTDSFFTNSSNYSENIGSVLTYGQVEALGIKSYTDAQKTVCVASEKIVRSFITIPTKMTCSTYQ